MVTITHSSHCLRLDLMGPSIAFLTSPEDANREFCVLIGVIPPGLSVPLHSHADVEDFYVIRGELEALRYGPKGRQWLTAKAGDYIHLPGGEPHAWRNVSGESAVMLVITTPKLGRFFAEVGRADSGEPVTPEDIARFMAVASGDYGYWKASPEENEAVGIILPGGGLPPRETKAHRPSDGRRSAG